jgi:5-bromo-4-chloroindolyl phosphate hydrolysis protein
MELTKEDLEFIEESLEYTRKNFEEYQKYPSYEYKQQRLDCVSDILNKVKQMKREPSGE